MKHFFLAIAVAILVFPSCQDANQSTTQSATQTPENMPAQPEAPKYDIAVLEKTAADAKAMSTEMENMLKQVDELPAKVKKANAAEVEVIRNDLSGILEKQRDMVLQFDQVVGAQQPDKKTIVHADNEGQNLMPVAAYMAQFDQYAKSIGEYKERIKKLGN